MFCVIDKSNKDICYPSKEIPPILPKIADWANPNTEGNGDSSLKKIALSLAYKYFKDILGFSVVGCENYNNPPFFVASDNSNVSIKLITYAGDSSFPSWTIVRETTLNFDLIAFFWLKNIENNDGEIIFAGYCLTDELTFPQENQIISLDDLYHPSRIQEHLKYLCLLEAKDYLTIGKDYFHKGKFELAIKFFTLEINSNPFNYEPRYWIARSYFALEKYLAVIPDISVAIDLAPLNPHFYILRSKALYERGDFDGAILDATTAIRVDPLNPYAYYNRASKLCASNFREEAINDYTAAIKLNPNDAYALFNIGKIHASLKDRKLASFYYNRAINVDPKSPPPPQRQLSTMEFEVVSLGLSVDFQKKSQHISQYYIIFLDSSIKLKMVFIPGGTFFIGSPELEFNHQNSEEPQTQILVPPFFMGKYPVTIAQWLFVARLPQIDCYLSPRPSEFKGSRLPVESISWHEAVEFCRRLSKFTGSFFRLPSEAEWEYACRAGTISPFNCGETITTDFANYDGKYPYHNCPRCGIYLGQTTDVGTFPPNAFGLHDMHGNVQEWCLDNWHSNHKDISTVAQPRVSFDSLAFKVTRGGDWYHGASRVRSSSRTPLPPDSRYNYLGFRVVGVDSVFNSK